MLVNHAIMAKSIKRNFLYNIILNISKVIFPLITAPYVSRVLEPDGVGLFNFANTYAGYFAMFAALGIPLYGVREIPKMQNLKGETKFVSEILSISVISTFLCSILFLLSVLFIPLLSENLLVFTISAIVLYLTPFKIDWYFQGKEEFAYITFRSLVVKTLSVILLFVLVHDKEDLILYVTLNAFCSIFNELWNFIKLYKIGIHPYFTICGKQHLRPLIVLFSSAIAIHIYVYIDTVMLGFITNFEEVGYYNCATHISKAILPIVTSLSAVAIPRVSILKETHSWEKINDLMYKSFSIVGYISFPIAIGVIVVSPVFVPLFFGELFRGAILPLQILITTIVVIGLNNITGMQILIGLGHDRQYLYSVLTGTFINLILNSILIPCWGAIGAAIASVLSEMIVLSVMTYYVYSKTKIRISIHKELLIDAFIACSFWGVAFGISQICVGWWYVLVTLFLCSSYYVAMQYFLCNSSELLLINLLFRKIYNNRHNLKKL